MKIIRFLRQVFFVNFSKFIFFKLILALAVLAILSSALSLFLVNDLTFKKTSEIEHYSQQLKQIEISDGDQDNFNFYKIEIPKGAISGSAKLEASVMPVHSPPSGLVNMGSSVSLGLIQWIPGENREGDSFYFKKPFNLFLKYDDSYEKDSSLDDHVLKEAMAIYFYEEDSREWQKLETDLDFSNNIAKTNRADSLGDYVLLAPLKCGAEEYEPYNDFSGTILRLPFIIENSVKTGNNPRYNEEILSRFDVVTDTDSFQFEAEKGKKYTIRTESLDTGVVTKIEIYDLEKNLVAQSFQSGLENELIWSLENYDATVFNNRAMFLIKISPDEDSSAGCQSYYNFTLIKD